MAIPLKTGADLYNNELLRARLHNHPADALDEYGVGSFYFNNSSGLNSSGRMRYRGLTAWHSVANLEDIEDVKDLIKALSGSSSESVASVLGRVITLEGYFSNGKAKDADLLDGHNSDYFATATTVNDLLEDYESFKAVFADNSDDYINTWTEVKNFLDGIKNTEDLNAILLGINTELGKKADKATTLAGYGITDGVLFSERIMGETSHRSLGYGYAENGWRSTGPAIVFGVNAQYRHLIQGTANADASLWHKAYTGNLEGGASDWYKILDDNNYASVLDGVYFKTTGGTINGATTIIGPSFSILHVYANTAADSAVGFYNKDGLLGYLGMSAGGDVGFWNKDWTFWRILHTGNYSDLITDLNKNLNVPSITIGGIKLSVVEGQLQIEGDAYATGQLSSGGIGSEGSGSGASGIVILEDWEKYDDALAQVLGAGLGVGLRDKIAALESKATKVSVSGLLESGKSIGTIKVDDTSYNLLAPDDYLPLSGGVIKGSLEKRLPTEGATQNYILFTRHNGTAQGYLGFNGVDNPIYIPSAANAIYSLLHEGNYRSFLDFAYLRVDGANVLKAPLISTSSYLTLNGCSLYAKDGSTADWRVTTKDWTAEFRLLHEGNYESIVGNKFLKLSGGTINTGDIAGLTIYRNNSKYSMVHFCNNEEGILVDVGYLGVVGEGVPVYLNSGGNQFNLLHSGNYGSVLNDAYFRVFSGGTYNANTISAGGIYRLDAQYEGGESWPIPPAYGNAIHVKVPLSDTAFQIAAPQFSTQRLFFRSFANSSQATQTWKEFAFTDSDITGNAASATKLATARSLWGNSFDGTADVNGSLTLSNNSDINGLASDGTSVALMGVGSDDIVRIASGAFYQQKATRLYGKSLAFYTATTPSLLINSSGNVTIGGSDLAGTDYKLYVNAGRVLFASVAGEAPALGTMSNMAIAVGLAEYGMQSYVLGNGSAHIQVGRFDGTAAAYSLCLNPLGGNVGIGISIPQYKLHVAGSAMFDATSRGLLLYGRKICRHTNGTAEGTFAVDIQDDYVAFNARLSPNINNTYTLGTASYRWANTYSVLGNFSSRLLVCGATDDGSTALQVNGTVKTTYVGSGLTTSITGFGYWKTYGTSSWARAFSAWKSDGSTELGGFGFMVSDDVLSHLYIGTYSNPYMRVYPADKIECRLNVDARVGVTIPTGKTLKIGDAILSWDSTAQALKVNKNFYSDGQVSSGGVAEAGTGGVGGSTLDRLVFEIPKDSTSFSCEHNLGTRDISVTIYEKGNDFQQVLADVYLDSTNVARIVFGSATDVAHKVVIIG